MLYKGKLNGRFLTNIILLPYFSQVLEDRYSVPSRTMFQFTYKNRKMKESLNAQHHQIMDCLRETEFYKQELTILQTRLEEVIAKNTSKEIQAQVEHFQNKFILTKEQLDILTHDLKAEENNIERKSAELPEHVHQKIMEIDTKLKEQNKDFTTGFADLRLEFNMFLSKVM